MEIGAEINKTFGTEIAKLFAEKISEQELMDKANEIWTKLKRDNGNYYLGESSELNKLVKAAILERMKEAITKYLDQENIQMDINERAKELVEEIRKEAERKIIDNTSDTLAMIYRNDTFGLKNYIINTIDEVIRR